MPNSIQREEDILSQISYQGEQHNLPMEIRLKHIELAKVIIKMIPETWHFNVMKDGSFFLSKPTLQHNTMSLPYWPEQSVVLRFNFDAEKLDEGEFGVSADGFVNVANLSFNADPSDHATTISTLIAYSENLKLYNKQQHYIEALDRKIISLESEMISMKGKLRSAFSSI